MPRLQRKRSKSSMYHIMIRGNERKSLFLDDDDRERFVDILYEKKKKGEYELFAYCLMDNHVHLLIKEGKDEIARIMKRINTSYAYYFNKKYKRIGHVFQDRYKSEVIENEGYLLAAVRYIHNNPVKAGLTRDALGYRWSSYRAYLSRRVYDNNIVDTKTILQIFSENEETARKKFMEFTSQESYHHFIEYVEEEQQDKKIILSYKDAKEFVQRFLEGRKLTKGALKERINAGIRNELIKTLKDSSTLSIREIAAILELDRNIVQRIK